MALETFFINNWLNISFKKRRMISNPVQNLCEVPFRLKVKKETNKLVNNETERKIRLEKLFLHHPLINVVHFVT